MALYKSAQFLADDKEPTEINLDDIVLYDELPSKEDVLEVHQSEEPKIDIVFKLPHMPGAPDVEPEELEVSCPEEGEKKEDAKDESKANDAEVAVADIWDLKHGGMKSVIKNIENLLSNIPKHSGKDKTGIERVISFLDRALKEVSKVVQNDYNGEIDISKLEHLCSEMEDGKDRCEQALEKMRAKKDKKKKAELEADMVKEGQRAVYTGGMVVTVPLLISAIARLIINGHVSAGHGLEHLYDQMTKKHGLDKNQKLELRQLLADMSYPMTRSDRLIDPSEDDFDSRSSDNGDFSAHYSA